MPTEERPESLDQQWWDRLRWAIVDWYDIHHRRLPWRETHDPYRIWVSEVMLQQTQVATVLEYYDRFLRLLPNIASLADASEEKVLKLWAGLGYYRRARQMHAASKVICEQYHGRFPNSLEEIRQLPGIGRYTAGAIASFAFDLPAPILEANTARLFSRLLMSRRDPKTSSGQAQLWEFAERCIADLPADASRFEAAERERRSRNKQCIGGNKGNHRHATLGPGRVNQALMELGSQICTPKSPKCLCCPVQKLCPTFKHGMQAQIPVVSSKPVAVKQNHVLVIVQDREKFLMRQNQADQWWAGLWDFPRIKTESKLPESKTGAVAWARGKSNSAEKVAKQKISAAAQKRIESDFWEMLELDCNLLDWVYFLRHAVTKHKISLYCFQAEIDAEHARQIKKRDGWRWVSAEEISAALPLTATAKRLLQWLQSQS